MHFMFKELNRINNNSICRRFTMPWLRTILENYWIEYGKSITFSDNFIEKVTFNSELFRLHLSLCLLWWIVDGIFLSVLPLVVMVLIDRFRYHNFFQFICFNTHFIKMSSMVKYRMLDALSLLGEQALLADFIYFSIYAILKIGRLCSQ